ncbi:heme peroxidase [Globomyces sp. JEL0801]|nr:heme peroxidase [Globomyces sp. JEL0801]
MLMQASLRAMRQGFIGRMKYSTVQKKSNTTPLFLAFGALGAGGAFYYYNQQLPPDYQSVYNDIANILDDNDYDDGSYGPVLVRLAWHAAGTFDKHSNTGGSNGATMRFHPESAHGANAGLSVPRKLLEQIKAKHPKITNADLWSLAGVVAIQEMGGPTVPWRPGRSDAVDEKACTPDGRLPDAAQAHDHVS